MIKLQKLFALVLLFLTVTLSSGQKMPKKVKAMVGTSCVTCDDCKMQELFCNMEDGKKNGKCEVKVGLSFPCTTDKMCYSGYCGSDGECEFSSKQLLIVLVAAMALGVLFLAASAPPTHREMYPNERRRFTFNNPTKKVNRKNRRSRSTKSETHLPKETDDDLTWNSSGLLKSIPEKAINSDNENVTINRIVRRPKTKKHEKYEKYEKYEPKYFEETTDMDATDMDGLTSDANNARVFVSKTRQKNMRGKFIGKPIIDSSPASSSSPASPPSSGDDCTTTLKPTNFDYDMM